MSLFPPITDEHTKKRKANLTTHTIYTVAILLSNVANYAIYRFIYNIHVHKYVLCVCI